MATLEIRRNSDKEFSIPMMPIKHTIDNKIKTLIPKNPLPKTIEKNTYSLTSRVSRNGTLLGFGGFEMMCAIAAFTALGIGTAGIGIGVVAILGVALCIGIVLYDLRYGDSNADEQKEKLENFKRKIEETVENLNSNDLNSNDALNQNLRKYRSMSLGLSSGYITHTPYTESAKKLAKYCENYLPETQELLTQEAIVQKVSSLPKNPKLNKSQREQVALVAAHFS